MKLNHLILTCLVLIASVTTHANNHIFTGINTAAPGFGINVETTVTDNWYVRTGISYSTLYNMYAVPVMMHFLMGETAHKLDLGVGAVLVEYEWYFRHSAVKSVGYRYMPESGVSYSCGLTLNPGSHVGKYYIGLGIGYAF